MNTATDLPVLELLPAVDVVNGQAVRLVQGEAGSETSYGTPLEAALNWQQQGAEWVHLVDLDAAFGRGSNAELLREVVGRLDIKVELSGGLRDDATLEAALDLGVARVNLGTAALENPEWTQRAIERFGDKIAVGLDVRGTTLAGRGWTKEGGDLWDVLGRLEEAGCSRYVVTDVTKDGTLQGPNVELLRQMVEKTGKPVVASGGISSLDDLKVLRSLVPLGVEGAIVGKALYAGAFTLPEALDVAGRRLPAGSHEQPRHVQHRTRIRHPCTAPPPGPHRRGSGRRRRCHRLGRPALGGPEPGRG
jgi:phosphoribosylformimino-5-aminoimidazole carboxamide ribotide isomerase/phosphoribosylanthranilate isomerase